MWRLLRDRTETLLGASWGQHCHVEAAQANPATILGRNDGPCAGMIALPFISHAASVPKRATWRQFLHAGTIQVTVRGKIEMR
jgi:hypothetical protein